jgi:5'-3' exonuclease, N-terminal resolvase-like domain/T4 RNase H, C terminal
MILVDFNQVAISNLFANIHGTGEIGVIDADLIRHMVLNSLRSYRKKFKNKYGELVICADNRHYWRKEVFPHYKANRKKDRENSTIDWNMVFETMGLLREELTEFFPYRMLNIPRAEADDIIGVLAKYEHRVENILVLSGDKDFAQLQKFKNVDQYAPIQKTFLTPDDPVVTLREHIMAGDVGDGIPNFKSADDTFVSGKRQTPIRKDDLARWAREANPENFCDLKMLRGYKRNQELIDLERIPNDVQDAIKAEWDKPFTPNRKNLLNYFVKHKLVNLLDQLSEF